MQLSLHTDYALRTLMALVATPDRQSVESVARRYGISANHLAKVAQALQAHGYVENSRGRNGGMRLTRDPRDIVVGDVVRRFENLGSFVGCMDTGTGCTILSACGLLPALRGALNAFLAHLDGITLADITSKETELQRLLFGEAA